MIDRVIVRLQGLFAGGKQVDSRLAKRFLVVGARLGTSGRRPVDGLGRPGALADFSGGLEKEFD
jgi:hypothetical protein